MTRTLLVGWISCSLIIECGSVSLAQQNSKLLEIEHRNHIAACKVKARKYTQTLIPALRLTPYQALMVYNIRINLSYQAWYAFKKHAGNNKKIVKSVKPIQRQFEYAMTALLTKEQKIWWDDYRKKQMVVPQKPLPTPEQKPEKPKTPVNNFFIIAEWSWD